MASAPSGPLRVVLDTNILVACAYAPGSASRQIVEACLRGELNAILSSALLREYEHILAQAVRGGDQGQAARQLLERATVVEPEDTPRVVPEDPEDDKLVAVARAAGAVLITNDQHLLQLHPLDSVRILRPGEFLRAWRLD